LVTALAKYRSDWVIEEGFVKEKVSKEKAVTQAEKLITKLLL